MKGTKMADNKSPRYDDGEKYGAAAYPAEKDAWAGVVWGESKYEAGKPIDAAISFAEAVQRRANKANHSERVWHGGNPGAGERDR